MPDMRYELRISGHEIMGSSTLLIEVWGNPYDLTEKRQRLLRRIVDVDHDGQETPQRWARDCIVALAEHL